jgi:hypothetical protein
MVVPALNGGFAQFQTPSDPASPWQMLDPFGQDQGEVSSVALIQSNFGDPGNLEIVAVMGTGEAAWLAHYWRDFEGTWFGPNVISLDGLASPAAPAGVPAFLQSRHGTQGHFEVVVPLSTGGLAHLRRDNDVPGFPWTIVQQFGEGSFRSASMIQSSFGSPLLGNLELAAQADNRIEHYWCADDSLQWYGPSAVIYTEPAANPQAAGEWRIEYICEPVGIHAALLNTGKLLYFAYDEENQMQGVSSVFNPDDGTVQHVPQATDLFCSGHTLLPDGRLLVAGGHVTGENSVTLFIPEGDGGAWQQLPDMPVGRWYPTCVTLPDGKAFVLSGSKKSGGGPVNDTYQIFDPAQGLQPALPAPFLNEVEPCNTFPFVFVLPGGRLFVFSYNRSCFFDLTTMTFGSERFFCAREDPRTYPLEGTCVLLPLRPDSNPPWRARAMVIGGGGLPLDITTPATTTCEILDTADPNPHWIAAAPMKWPRVMPDAVLLPDGTVLVMSGSQTGKADQGVEPVMPAEIYDPVTDTWHPAAEMRVPRLYHSTALLLPDATVVTAGLDESFNLPPYNYPEYRLEIYRPPYLFRGPRPELNSAPESITWGQQFTVSSDDADSIASAALLRAGSCTHSFNPDQRYVGLSILQRSSGSLTLESPPDGTVAPPGNYLLFILTSAGVPSTAAQVNLS